MVEYLDDPKVLQSLFQMMDFEKIHEAEIVCKSWRDLITRRRDCFARKKATKATLDFGLYTDECHFVFEDEEEPCKTTLIDGGFVKRVKWIGPEELNVHSIMQFDLVKEFNCIPQAWYTDVRKLNIQCCGKALRVELLYFLPRFKNLKSITVKGYFREFFFRDMLKRLKTVQCLSLNMDASAHPLKLLDIHDRKIRAILKNQPVYERQVAYQVRWDYKQRRRAFLAAKRRAKNGQNEPEVAKKPANQAEAEFGKDCEPARLKMRQPFRKVENMVADDKDLENLIAKSDKLERFELFQTDNTYSAAMFIRFLQEASFASECHIFCKFWPSEKAKLDFWIRYHCRLRLMTDIEEKGARYFFELRGTVFHIIFDEDRPQGEEIFKLIVDLY
ncbi:unnamed protein product [Caenorhabditis auriculariae]|uniref:F-box domain-containing protein n=1 Tax=Caenorhabditis auriculariae TaxID=2777116 RepID=A0A8S1HID9_9PELO|nr:unnamed protein product [Caenorhabditis auriculariae]